MFHRVGRNGGHAIDYGDHLSVVHVRNVGEPGDICLVMSSPRFSKCPIRCQRFRNRARNRLQNVQSEPLFDVCTQHPC